MDAAAFPISSCIWERKESEIHWIKYMHDLKGQISRYITCTTEAGSIWHAIARAHIKVYNFRESASSRLAIVAGNACKKMLRVMTVICIIIIRIIKQWWMIYLHGNLRILVGLIASWASWAFLTFLKYLRGPSDVKLSPYLQIISQ